MRMTALFRCLGAVACLYVLTACSSPVEDSVESAKIVQGMAVSHAWARPTLTQKQPGGVYLQITNNTNTADTLVAVSSPWANRGEMHNNVHQDGIVRMVRLEDVPINSGATVSFMPGGMHIMLMGLDSQLTAGQDVLLTLSFEHAGDIEVTAVVSADMKGMTGMEGNHGH
jgi:periplasmic copper chaperone A